MTVIKILFLDNPTHDSTYQQLLMNNPNTTPDLYDLMNVAKINTVVVMEIKFTNSNT